MNEVKSRPEQIIPQNESEDQKTKKHGYKEFEAQAVENLAVMSRTSRGISDTSSSEQKPALQTDGGELARKSLQNFKEALKLAWNKKQDEFQTPEYVKRFLEETAGIVSNGLLKEGQSLWRTWETKFRQTPPAQIAQEMEIFYKEFHKRLNSPDTDPKEFAGWIERRFDSQIHPLADGCGRTSKVLSGFVLARANHPLPRYRDRDGYYQMVGKSDEEWNTYYKSLFEEKDK